MNISSISSVANSTSPALEASLQNIPRLRLAGGPSLSGIVRAEIQELENLGLTDYSAQQRADAVELWYDRATREIVAFEQKYRGELRQAQLEGKISGQRHQQTLNALEISRPFSGARADITRIYRETIEPIRTELAVIPQEQVAAAVAAREEFYSRMH